MILWENVKKEIDFMGNQEGLGDAATPSRSLWGNSLAVYPTSSPVLEQRWARRLARRL
jgi:hypothetical protein